MSGPTRTPMRQLNFSLPASEAAAFVRLAGEHGTTLTGFFRDLVRAAERQAALAHDIEILKSIRADEEGEADTDALARWQADHMADLGLD